MTNQPAGGQEIYNREQFPVSGVLADLTSEIKDSGGTIQPVEAYEKFSRATGQLGLGRVLDYHSTSITTGGHARVPGQAMGAIIAANTQTAREMVRSLEAGGSIEANETLLPVDLGNTGWNQQQFMGYWALSIAGPDIRQIAANDLGLSRFEARLAAAQERHGVDSAVMTDGSLPRAARAPQYSRFVQAYADTIRHEDAGFQPVRRFVSLVDPAISLGCSAERELAADLGIPRFRVTALRPGSVDELPQPTLREDLAIITAHGGEAVVAAEAGSSLQLRRDMQPVETPPDWPL